MPGDGVFISYRRSDSASMAGRIHDLLTQRLGGRKTFLDVSSIAPGSNFERRIEGALRQSSVMLVVMGSRWSENVDGTSRSRLWDADDYVRFEIAWALRHGLEVIPVRIDDAGMPHRDDLPDDIGDLALKNAAEIRNSRFSDDFERLLAAIEGRGDAGTQRERSGPRRTILTTMAGGVGGVLLLLLALIAHHEVTGEPISNRIGLVGALALVPISAVGGAWLARRRTRGR